VTGARRFSQAISEGDGISIVVLVDGPDAAQQAEADGAEGVPAHVTLIYPFIDDAELAAGHVQGLRAVLAPYASFDVRFATFGCFPGPPPVLYLEPHPAQPFLDMINAIVECFPAYSPFGQFDPLVPHLTVAQINDTRVLQVAETRVASKPRRLRPSVLMPRGRP